MSNDICGICHLEIDRSLELDGKPEYITIGGKQVPVCSDCFYDELGKGVEEHPIHGGAPHRG